MSGLVVERSAGGAESKDRHVCALTLDQLWHTQRAERVVCNLVSLLYDFVRGLAEGAPARPHRVCSDEPVVGCLFQAESRRSESRVDMSLYTASLSLTEKNPKLRWLVTVVQTNG